MFLPPLYSFRIAKPQISNLPIESALLRRHLAILDVEETKGLDGAIPLFLIAAQKSMPPEVAQSAPVRIKACAIQAQRAGFNFVRLAIAVRDG